MNAASLDHDAAVAELSALLDRNRLAAARGVLANALPAFPESPQLLQYAAWVEWLEGDREAALTHVNDALTIDPHAYGSRNLLARIHIEAGRYAEAESTILELLADYPEEPALLALYSRLMLLTFHLEKAEQLAAEALRIDPESEEALNAHVLCGFVLSPGEEQKQRLQKLLTEHPDQLETTLRLVQLLIDEGKNRQAYELSRTLVQIYPDDDGIVEMAVSLKRASHWSLLPLLPMQKWGWAGSIGVWFAVVLLLGSGVLDNTPLGPHQNTIALIFIAWVIYSWVWPPILKSVVK